MVFFLFLVWFFMFFLFFLFLAPLAGPEKKAGPEEQQGSNRGATEELCDWSLSACMYVCMHVYMCVYIHMYVCIHTALIITASVRIRKRSRARLGSSDRTDRQTRRHSHFVLKTTALKPTALLGSDNPSSTDVQEPLLQQRLRLRVWRQACFQGRRKERMVLAVPEPERNHKPNWEKTFVFGAHLAPPRRSTPRGVDLTEDLPSLYELHIAAV